MKGLTTVTGRLIDVRRYIHVQMRWCEQYPARERWELWMQTAQRLEVKLIVHTRVMPARRGHHLVAVLRHREFVGLSNLTTGTRANFVRSDPPLLFRRCDAVAVAAVLASATSLALAGYPMGAAIGYVSAMIYLPLLIATRLILRFLLARRIDRGLRG